MTYGTTPGFLDHFGLDAIGDLPGLDELKGAGLLDGRLPPGFRCRCRPTTRRCATDEDPLETGRSRPRSRRPDADDDLAPEGRWPDQFATRRLRWGRAARRRRIRPPRFRGRRASLRRGSTRSTTSTLDVAPGEIVCLLGPSGCGKTTLLRLAAGVERPSAGPHPDRRPGGRRARRLRAAGAARRRPDVPGLRAVPASDHPRQRHVRAQVAARGRCRARRRGARSTASGCGARRDYPHMLSGGEQQRVALARAIAPRPGVLLMDEPFSGLDRRLRDACATRRCTCCARAGATCVIVTHDPEEAMRIADRIALMRAGRLVQAGAPEELYRAPADLFAARFFCELNEVARRRARAGASTTPVGRFAAPGLPDGAAAIVCIRPQGVQPDARRLRHPGRVLAARRFLGEVDCSRSRSRASTAPAGARPRAASSLTAGERGRPRHRSGRSPCFCRGRTPRFAPSTVGARGDAASGRGVGGFAMGGMSIWHWIIVGIDRDAAVRARQDFRADGRRRQGHQGLQEGHGRGRDAAGLDARRRRPTRSRSGTHRALRPSRGVDAG